MISSISQMAVNVVPPLDLVLLDVRVVATGNEGAAGLVVLVLQVRG